jgi:hypothetical protein
MELNEELLERFELGGELVRKAAQRIFASASLRIEASVDLSGLRPDSLSHAIVELHQAPEDWFANRLFLRDKKSMFLISKDVLAKPEDPRLDSPSIPHVVRGEEVYYWLMVNQETKLANIREYLARTNAGWHQSIIICGMNLKSLDSLKNGHLDDSLADEIERTAVAVYLRTNDGDAFVCVSG